jgi:hypothetical protein
VLRGFHQFDAPVCVIITYDRGLDGSDDTPFDCGAAATALVNAARSRGLGAVINREATCRQSVLHRWLTGPTLPLWYAGRTHALA